MTRPNGLQRGEQNALPKAMSEGSIRFRGMTLIDRRATERSFRTVPTNLTTSAGWGIILAQRKAGQIPPDQNDRGTFPATGRHRVYLFPPGILHLSACDTAVHGDLARQTRKILASLFPREEKIVRMRFGIGEKTSHTLEEVGRDFEPTSERIRQIEDKAIKRLGRSR